MHNTSRHGFMITLAAVLLSAALTSPAPVSDLLAPGELADELSGSYGRNVSDNGPLSPDLARVTSVRLHLPAGASAVVKNIAGLLGRRIEERGGARVIAEGQVDLDLYLDIEPGIGSEGYVISNSPLGGIRIAGNDER